MKNKPAVVFVCVENSCRSQMAEGFARMIGGDVWEIHSAGSRPSGKVNPKAIESMKEVGYDLSGHHSKGLQDLPPLVFEYAITMGCGDECPRILANNRLDWQIADPKHLEPQEFRKIRDLIQCKVKELLGSVK